ncbi:substrate-binding domain-containing protein [Sulfurimonas lithotrophica]|uniref:Substrate-binding domain-containing protein n=1 Tax=Sulfurimonas lithotrophica TaxID=2590022 RepID=A0A5P8NXX3_9BACT|nr:substrate-binding domain-containing protein [Sulfurimonas lithotrophica]QFR48282.1 substrate-binding domain-containing protein [Sulfurimonas lithotrophica]
MFIYRFLTYFTLAIVFFSNTHIYALDIDASNKKIAYLVSDMNIPFWNIMSKGISSKSNELGYEIDIYSADNSAKKELENTVNAIKTKVNGIILSPTNSSAAVTVLKLAQNAHIPVVIADIGTQGGKYISYISSNNKDGAYKIGKILAKEMYKRNWQKGSVGIIAIPQSRDNGKERTAGFMKALSQHKIQSSNLYQQVDFSYAETYDFSIKLIKNDPKLRAIWLQGSDKYQAALDAVIKSGKKDKILLICFDAEPSFMDLIPKGILTAAAMQQPFLIGEKAVLSLDSHLKGLKVELNQQVPVLAISAENMQENISLIKRNVLGLKQNK